MIVDLQWNDTQLLHWIIELHPSKKAKQMQFRNYHLCRLQNSRFFFPIRKTRSTVTHNSRSLDRKASLPSLTLLRRFYTRSRPFVRILPASLAYAKKHGCITVYHFCHFAFRSRAPGPLLIPANGWWGHPAFIKLDLTFLNKVCLDKNNVALDS